MHFSLKNTRKKFLKSQTRIKGSDFSDVNSIPVGVNTTSRLRVDIMKQNNESKFSQILSLRTEQKQAFHRNPSCFLSLTCPGASWIYQVKVEICKQLFSLHEISICCEIFHSFLAALLLLLGRIIFAEIRS